MYFKPSGMRSNALIPLAVNPFSTTLSANARVLRACGMSPERVFLELSSLFATRAVGAPTSTRTRTVNGD